MTWQQYCAARQLITEERLGAPLRRKRAAEDAAAERTKELIRKQDVA
jgi:hypothetical protein